MPKVVIAEDEFMNLDMIAEVLPTAAMTSRHCPDGAGRDRTRRAHKPDLAAIYPHLADCGSQSSPPNELGEPFLAADDVENGKPLQRQCCCISVKTPPRQGLLKMLTPVQQHAVDQSAKSLPALGDDALIDTYHQAWEDHRAARAEGSDNLSKAYANSLATEKAMRDRFPDYQGRYRLRYP